MLNKGFTYLLFVFLFVIFFAPVVKALTLEPSASTTEVVAGGTYEYYIDIDTEGESVSSMGLAIDYDPRVLENPQIIKGNTPLTFSIQSTSPNGDKTRMVLQGRAGSGFTGSGRLLSIKFDVKNPLPRDYKATEICEASYVDSPTPTPVPPTPYPTATPYRDRYTPAPTIPSRLVVRNTPPGEVLGVQTAGAVGLGFLIFGIVGAIALKASKSF